MTGSKLTYSAATLSGAMSSTNALPSNILQVNTMAFILISNPYHKNNYAFHNFTYKTYELAFFLVQNKLFYLGNLENA